MEADQAIINNPINASTPVRRRNPPIGYISPIPNDV